ncbi:MAG: hypothetical protein ABIK07_02055 [Planctomycetota bacterium]
MKQYPIHRRQYWVFLIVFSLCALLGFVGVLVGEIFLPDNPGGNQGRLAMYRSLGLVTLAWAGIAGWSASALWTSRTSQQE